MKVSYHKVKTLDEDVPASTQTGTSKQRETVATVPDKIVEAQGWVISQQPTTIPKGLVGA